MPAITNDRREGWGEPELLLGALADDAWLLGRSRRLPLEQLHVDLDHGVPVARALSGRAVGFAGVVIRTVVPPLIRGDVAERRGRLAVDHDAVPAGSLGGVEGGIGDGDHLVE